MITLALLILALVGTGALIMIWLARLERWYGWLCLVGAVAALGLTLWLMPSLAVVRREW